MEDWITFKFQGKCPQFWDGWKTLVTKSAPDLDREDFEQDMQRQNDNGVWSFALTDTRVIPG